MKETCAATYNNQQQLASLKVSSARGERASGSIIRDPPVWGVLHASSCVTLREVALLL
jgi:hypothetical protein